MEVETLGQERTDTTRENCVNTSLAALQKKTQSEPAINIKNDETSGIKEPQSPKQEVFSFKKAISDPRKPILKDSYYMSAMKQAVDNDPGLDAEFSRQFKTHVVQNHQNLHEVLEAKSSE